MWCLSSEAPSAFKNTSLSSQHLCEVGNGTHFRDTWGARHLAQSENAVRGGIPSTAQMSSSMTIQFNGLAQQISSKASRGNAWVGTLGLKGFRFCFCHLLCFVPSPFLCLLPLFICLDFTPFGEMTFHCVCVFIAQQASNLTHSLS